MGWPQNEAPQAFYNVALSQSSARLAELMERYRPQVVVTYDENGFYGHPDHIQANRITLAAAQATGIPDKLYYPGVARSRIKSFAESLASGVSNPLDRWRATRSSGRPTS